MAEPPKGSRVLWFLSRTWLLGAKVLSVGLFKAMVRDKSWQEPLITSLSPAPNSRVLAFGPGSAWIAVTLALRFPEAVFVGVDPDSNAVDKARRRTTRRLMRNVSLVHAPLHARLPFNAAAFEKAVCVLTFHDQSPEDKIQLAKELIRVLRRGGTLLLAEYDKPDKPGEDRILRLDRYVLGASVAESHITGRWTEFLAKAGFSSIRRESSQSIGIGRISVVKARKR